MITTFCFQHHGTNKWDYGILETTRLSDSSRMAMTNKFFLALSPQTADTSFLQELTSQLSFGMLKVNASTQLRIIFIKIGFQRSDTFQLEEKAVSLDNILLQLDGMVILKSGITKHSILKIHLKLMRLILMLWLFHQEEISLWLEEKIWK